MKIGNYFKEEIISGKDNFFHYPQNLNSSCYFIISTL